MTPNLFLVKPDDIESLWLGVRPLVQKALKHAEGALTTTDILRFLLNSRMHLWVGFKDKAVFTAVIVEVIKYPRHKICRIITTATASGHEFDAWYPTMFKNVEKWALSQGCIAFEAWCRKGLARKLKWDHEHAVIYKVLNSNKEVINE